MKRDACLRLVLPHSLEEQVVDLLLGHPEWVGGFTAYEVDGHGSPQAIASSAEQVRGRAGRVQIEILLAAEHASFLVDSLRAELPNADVAWWLGPVIAAGDFR
jgi:hypothetical protein